MSADYNLSLRRYNRLAALFFHVLLLIFCIASAAYAGGSIIFTQSKMIIKPAPAPDMNDEREAGEIEEKTTNPASPPLPHRSEARPALELSVTVRPLISLYSAGFFVSRPIGEGEGIIFHSQIPTMLQVRRVNFYTAVDILAIDKEGVITHIVPNIIPAELTTSIDLPGYLLALLYLPGGFCKQYGIIPGDRIIHPLFSVTPEISK